MKQQIKIFCLHILKFAGVFALWRRFSPRGLQILCYHGIAFQDEHHFKPGLFMHPETFRDRLRLVQRAGCAVLPLDEAVDRLGSNSLPRNAVAITIDDGWQGALSHAVPALHEAGMPATLYVTTYYVINQEPVFNIAVRYLLWRGRTQRVDLAQCGIPDGATMNLSLPDDMESAAATIIRHGLDHRDMSGRAELLRSLAACLDIDPAVQNQPGLFHLMSVDGLVQAADSGIDIQLHTHRHRSCKDDHDAFVREIHDNRTILQDVAPTRLEHFCYPSGNFGEQQFSWLASLGVVSATTCAPGINYPGANPYALKRFLDSEQMTPIEFEAELAGLGQLWR